MMGGSFRCSFPLPTKQKTNRPSPIPSVGSRSRCGMDVGDLSKVWEVKALKKPGEEDATKMLEKIAGQVQPIMRKRKWKVKLLREFCPANPALLGLNVGGGVEVKLRLRRPNRDWDFFPYEQVLDTMLHELCHIAHRPHNASFYKLWDELRKECEDLISRGVTGTGQGFDLPGRRLGGFSRQPPLPGLRQAAAVAAEKRARVGSLLPSGSKRLGGDSDIMIALSPIQAAAMAAERRMQDDLWCGSVSSGNPAIDNESTTSVHVESNVSSDGPRNPISEKRASGAISKAESHVLKVHCTDPRNLNSGSSSKTRSIAASTTGSLDSHRATDVTQDKAFWECSICTLQNQPLALACDACGIEKPEDVSSKYKLWSCKFCTLENSTTLDKCSACGSWRYSLGPPVSTRGPNLGT